MYEQFYGLQEAPFQDEFDRKFLFADEQRRRAYDWLLAGLSQNISTLILTGEDGVGKTTLLKTLVNRLQNERKVALVAAPEKHAEGLMRQILNALSPQENERAESSDASMQLYQLLRSLQSSGENVCVILDDVEFVDDDALRELLLFAEFETKEKRLLQLCLSGGPELGKSLNSGEFQLLHAHAKHQIELKGYSFQDSVRYIRRRLLAAGLAPESAIFEQSALAKIHEISKGLPRRINEICEKALKTGLSHRARYIDDSIVEASLRAHKTQKQPSAILKKETTLFDDAGFDDPFQTPLEPELPESGRSSDFQNSGANKRRSPRRDRPSFLDQENHPPKKAENGKLGSLISGFDEPLESRRKRSEADDSRVDNGWPLQGNLGTSENRVSERNIRLGSSISNLTEKPVRASVSEKDTGDSQIPRVAPKHSGLDKKTLQRENNKIARLVADEVHDRMRFLLREYMLFKRPGSWFPVILVGLLCYLISIMVILFFVR